MKMRIIWMILAVMMLTLVMSGCKKETDSSAKPAKNVEAAIQEENSSLSEEPNDDPIEEIPVREEQSKPEEPKQESEEPKEESQAPQEQAARQEYKPYTWEEKMVAYAKLPSMVKEVRCNGEMKLELLTDGEVGKDLGFDVYLVGVECFKVELGGKTMGLREAIKQDPSIVSKMINEWEKNGYAGSMKEGGTKLFYHKDVYGIKYNRLADKVLSDGTLKDGIYKDFFIGDPEIIEKEKMLELAWNFEFIPQLKLGDVISYFPQAEEKYGRLSLREDRHFLFFPNIHEPYVAQGSYTLSGNQLTLKTNDPFNNTYLFRKEGESFVFVAEGSAPTVFEDGTRFELKN